MLNKWLIPGALLLTAGFLYAADTRLPDAAMQGDREAVRTLLQQKVDVNVRQGDGSTALHWAAFREDIEMTKMLLAAGADVKAATREGAITPLFMACSSGSAPIVEALLKAGADPNSVKSNGTTALMTAASSGSPEAVKVLLDHGANINAKESVHGQTALMFASGYDRADVIKVLLAHGADPNLLTVTKKVENIRFDQDGNLIEANAGAKTTTKEEDEAAAAAAAKAADDAARDSLNTFARALQLKSAEYAVAKAKTKAGDIAFRAPQRVGPELFGGMTALLYAAREGYLDSAKALVEGGADINEVSGDKYTPLVLAIANGHLGVAEYLLEKGADPNKAAATGLTPLYATIDIKWAPKAWVPNPVLDQEKISYLQLMSNLLDHGANINARIDAKSWFRSYGGGTAWVDEAGATAFWRAAEALDLDAMRLLIKRGADPKIPNKLGDTPLMVAAGLGWAANWSIEAPNNRMDVVKYCLELGNEVTTVDQKGYTALHGAAYLGNNDLVNYLAGLGADIKAKSKAGDTVADMANGPTRFGMPHPDTVALLEKLGSANSHNCRSDQCVVAANAVVYGAKRPPSPAEQADRNALNTFALALGMQSAEYVADMPPAQGFGRGGNRGGAGAPPVPAAAASSAAPAPPQ